MTAIAPLSLIVPVHDNIATLEADLAALQPLRQLGHELLLVDGGSRDGSVTLARKLADRVLLCGTGLALQMNTGSEYASHELLLFLTPDTRLPLAADSLITHHLMSGVQWGHFNLRFAHGGLVAWAAAVMLNRRSRQRGLPIAQQAIFCRRQFFERVTGFDMAATVSQQLLCRRLQQAAPALCLPQVVTNLTGELRTLF